jgi:hypothetical protein
VIANRTNNFNNSVSITWYPNDGAGHFGLKKYIFTNLFSSSFISVGDLTGDARPDLVSNPGILWFENIWPNTVSTGICNDSIQFQIANDTICLGDPISGTLIPTASGDYFWNLGNFYIQEGSSFSWVSDSSGLFDLGVSLIQDGCIKDTVIQIFIDPCLSLNEKVNVFFTLFPNPSRTEVSIAIPANSKKGYLIELTDLLGKSILQRSSIGESLFTISVSDHSSGVYLLSVTDQETNSKQTQQLNSYSSQHPFHIFLQPFVR